MKGLELFPARIKGLRTSMNMTQKDFSTLIGISQQTLAECEGGIAKPMLDTIISIAQKCNVTTDWLCGLSDEMTA